MAYYAALVSLAQLLKDITRPDHPYAKSLLDKQQIHVSLYEKFNLVQELLEDYSPKDLNEESTDIMERRIRDASYRAQDIIESHISTIHTEKRAHGVERLFRHLLSTFRKAHSKRQPHRFEEHTLDNIVENNYQDLEKVKAEVNSIVEELTRIKVGSNTIHEDLQLNYCISAEASKIGAFSPKKKSKVRAPSGRNTMLVFDKHFMTTIKDQLCGESSKLEVISIAGMGGLGKTTLARNIFDDKLIHDRFDCLAWVTVSLDYDLKNILLAIVYSLNINKEELDGVGKEVLQQHIYKHLFGRRYFIVMDDIWDTKFWDDIRRIFPDNSNGSRIMTTTRLSDVAVYASSSKFHHQMQFLNEDQSWTLLREKLFAQEHCPKELEVIGKSIANNCKGLPLAIVVIAGVLSNVKRAPHDWEDIARNVNSAAIDQNNEHLSKILSLSYNHLPHHLKPCFLYLGGFPEDHEISISKLVRLWVAEGFLKPIESRILEEVGEEYFKDLVDRNLVLITRKKSNGKFKRCIIHDLLRDLCSQRARYESFFFCLRHSDDFFHRGSIGNVRRVYIQNWGEFSLLCRCMKIHCPHIRSVISSYKQIMIEECPCPLLRVLDIRIRLTSSFPNKILELLHLRYLTVGASPIRSLICIHPRISALQNLQTLILGVYVSLPSEIWKMPQLRHVMSKRGVTLPPIPYGEIRIIDGVPLLGSLQTLYRVIDFSFTSDTTQMIPSLKKLEVIYSEVHSCGIWEEFGLDNIVHLHQLKTLCVWFERSMIATPLPENFAIPSTLIKLSLKGCRLPWKDMGVVGSLPNLQVLKLSENAFMGEEWEPIEGEFLKLKSLQMEELSLKYWQAKNTHFPCLEHLCIRSCFKLDEIPPEIGDISTLQLIEVYENENSVLVSSALKIQEEQRDLGNDDLQVRVVPLPRG